MSRVPPQGVPSGVWSIQAHQRQSHQAQVPVPIHIMRSLRDNVSHSVHYGSLACSLCPGRHSHHDSKLYPNLFYVFTLPCTSCHFCNLYWIIWVKISLSSDSVTCYRFDFNEYILSRTRYTFIANMLFIYGTTIWNLYMVVYVHLFILDCFILYSYLHFHFALSSFCIHYPHFHDLHLQNAPFGAFKICTIPKYTNLLSLHIIPQTYPHVWFSCISAYLNCIAVLMCSQLHSKPHEDRGSGYCFKTYWTSFQHYDGLFSTWGEGYFFWVLTLLCLDFPCCCFVQKLLAFYDPRAHIGNSLCNDHPVGKFYFFLKCMFYVSRVSSVSLPSPILCLPTLHPSHWSKTPLSPLLPYTNLLFSWSTHFVELLWWESW